jgi:chaperonin GroEL
MNINNSPKELLFDDDARQTLLKGVQQLADAVRVTMGPGGLNVVIERPGKVPILTKDGVTVAKAINLQDRMQNLGVQLVKEAAQGAADVAGDGTTTATVLAYALFSSGLRAINSGHNPVKIRNGIRAAGAEIINRLYEKSKRIESNEEIINVGTISANGEKRIGEFLCEAMETVGRDGIITVEDAKGYDTSLIKVEGTRLNRGFLSPYFINDTSKNVCKLDNPYILLANRPISSIKELLPLLEKIHQTGRPLLLIADDVDGDALKALVLNNVKGVLNCCAIRSPEFGQARVLTMKDLAFMLNAKVVTSSEESSIESFKISDLGTCDQVMIHKNETTIIGCKVDKDELRAYCDEIRIGLDNFSLSVDEEAAHRRRLSRLAGGVAILRVGAATEAELRERKDRVEDALYATRAAVSNGILEGGGTSLLRVSNRIKTNLQGDELIGFNIVKQACQEPIRQIAKNSGEIPDIIVEKTLSKKSPNGFDARKNTWVNLLETGVIDPTLVVVSALQHAISAADNLLSVACAMHGVEEKTQTENEIYE